MAEHTKGPWAVEQPWNGFSAIRDAAGKLIFGLAAGSHDEKRSDAECDANARLIAAAPEMFEALKECEEYFDQRADADQPHGCDSPIPNEEMKLLMAIRAALSKAETGVEK